MNDAVALLVWVSVVILMMVFPQPVHSPSLFTKFSSKKPSWGVVGGDEI